MKTSIAILSVAAVAATAASAEEKTWDISGFEAVSTSAGIDAEVKTNTEFSVRAVGDAEDVARLDIRLAGETLEIGRKRTNFSWRRKGPLTVYVTLPDLKALEASSGSSVSARGVAAGAFAIDASSGASLSVEGRCEALTVDVSSGADVDAEKLQCRTGVADASSGGSADIYLADSLVADASSGGSVKVYGGPENVETDASSGGSVSVIE